MENSGSSFRYSDLGLLTIRLILAVLFIYAGGIKLFGSYFNHEDREVKAFTAKLEKVNVPQPKAAALACALTEFLGGGLLLFGALTRLTAIPLAINMFVAVYLAPRMMGADDFVKVADSVMFPLTVGFILLGLILTGPGWLSVDGCFARGRCRAATDKPATPAKAKT